MSQSMPVNHGRLDRELVIIEECVVCGETHRHGAAGFVDGESTRVAHCAGDRREYRVVIQHGGTS